VQAQQGCIATSLLDHFRAQIDAGDFPGWPDSAGGEQAVHAWPASKVQHGLTRTDFAQAERVADTAKRFRHRSR
jgi:hypothetical protein